jgi:hypothetical protein
MSEVNTDGWTREELEQAVKNLWPLYLLARAAHADFDAYRDEFRITRQAWDALMDEPFNRLERLATKVPSSPTGTYSPRKRA